MIESIPSWILDTAGGILTLIALWFYVFNIRTAWHFSNVSLIPYLMLFFALPVWPLFTMQACFVLFGIHGYILWYLQDVGSRHAEWWRLVTTPIALILGTLAYITGDLSDVWGVMAFAIAALSIVASWGLAQRMAWSWIVWLPANVLGFFYYFHSELWFLTFLQIPLFLFSVYGYYEWTRGETSKKGLIVSKEGNDMIPAIGRNSV